VLARGGQCNAYLGGNVERVEMDGIEVVSMSLHGVWMLLLYTPQGIAAVD
jgi:hypothetical protein